jgi:hypothetical protein
MTIFDYLNDIQTTKRCDLPVDDYNNFMVARWMSFYSDKVAVKINESLNFNGDLDKDMHYKMMACCVPKTKYPKKTSYIKKLQTKANKKQEDLSVLASNLEISQKELQALVEFKQSLE